MRFVGGPLVTFNGSWKSSSGSWYWQGRSAQYNRNKFISLKYDSKSHNLSGVIGASDNNQWLCLYTIEGNIHMLAMQSGYESSPCKPPFFRSNVDFNHELRASWFSTPVEILVMFAFSDGALSFLNSPEGSNHNTYTYSRLAVSQANESFINSNLNINIAYTTPILFNASAPDMGYAFSKFSVDQEVQNDRRKGEVDVAVLVTSFAPSSDPANKDAGLTRLRPGHLPDFSESFAVIDAKSGVLPGQNSFVHEMGHLFGAGHDAPSEPAVFPFAHAYKDEANGFSTVMSYACMRNGVDLCPRKLIWSSPQQSLRIESPNTGVSVSVGTANNDNRQALDRTATAIAAIHTKQPKPPQAVEPSQPEL